MKLNPNDRLRVAWESDVCLKTVEKWDRGGKVSDKSIRRIQFALAKLGLIVPGEAQSADEVAK